jgi:hypothetical protein
MIYNCQSQSAKLARGKEEPLDTSKRWVAPPLLSSWEVRHVIGSIHQRGGMGMVGDPALIFVFTCMSAPPSALPPVLVLTALEDSLCRMAARVNKKLFPL